MKHQKPPTVRDGFRFAGAGLLYAVLTQRNFRIHLVIASLVIILSCWLQISRPSWAILVVVIGYVLTAEIFNTASEVLVDLASPDYHPLAKQVKDLAAGGVLVSAIVAVVVGVLILGPQLLTRLSMLLE
ncbi:MAG: diacylglycerol kinase family protein [Chloroflexota bacterium]|nr:diacylglycerol kinase family protein [Chloroflexota bacterium]